jgi:hypothetical protein
VFGISHILIDVTFARLDKDVRMCYNAICIKRGLAPSPTCLPGQGGKKKPVLQVISDAAERQRNGFVSFLGVSVARTARTSGAF